MSLSQRKGEFQEAASFPRAPQKNAVQTEPLNTQKKVKNIGNAHDIGRYRSIILSSFWSWIIYIYIMNTYTVSKDSSRSCKFFCSTFMLDAPYHHKQHNTRRVTLFTDLHVHRWNINDVGAGYKATWLKQFCRNTPCAKWRPPHVHRILWKPPVDSALVSMACNCQM